MIWLVPHRGGGVQGWGGRACSVTIGQLVHCLHLQVIQEGWKRKVAGLGH